eukprot:COSAG03_NODE_2709_length_2507_cov_295.037791_3_plen_98_part_00
MWDSMVGGGGPEQAGLYSALAQLGMEELGTAGGLLGALLDCATEGFDAVVTLPRRKLCALALCKVHESLSRSLALSACQFVCTFCRGQSLIMWSIHA